jgi:hypothetical protein
MLRISFYQDRLGIDRQRKGKALTKEGDHFAKHSQKEGDRFAGPPSQRAVYPVTTLSSTCSGEYYI